MLRVSSTVLPPAVELAIEEARELIPGWASSAGGRLPGERTMAASIGVSRTTLRAALRQLASEGLIEGHPQRGWFLRAHTQLSDRASQLESFSEIALARGFKPSSTVLALEVRRAALEETERLQVPPASLVIDLTRLRRVDSTAVCIDRSLMPNEQCSSVLDADLSTAGLFESLEQRCHITLHHSDCDITARGATLDEAALLDLEPGDAVLQLASITYSTTGELVVMSDMVYRGDSYRFQATTYRRRR